MRITKLFQKKLLNPTLYEFRDIGILYLMMRFIQDLQVSIIQNRKELKLSLRQKMSKQVMEQKKVSG